MTLSPREAQDAALLVARRAEVQQYERAQADLVFIVDTVTDISDEGVVIVAYGSDGTWIQIRLQQSHRRPKTGDEVLVAWRTPVSV